MIVEDFRLNGWGAIAPPPPAATSGNGPPITTYDPDAYKRRRVDVPLEPLDEELVLLLI